ncbi:hypothetical protein [Bacillus cereus]|uniref:hypothetical protein n=1 Tax=Bacillus cereus TaxID=1396 RepID=UPI00123A8EB3|nr:hypothetical protein [Bacillus cereus]KAA6479395.1 hypothetical protein DX931_13875 [Bacillus cereus]
MRIKYTAVDKRGGKCTRVICEKKSFQCIIDREEANEGDTFEVCEFDLFTVDTPKLIRKSLCQVPVDILCEIKGRITVKVCIRKNDCNECGPIHPPC